MFSIINYIARQYPWLFGRTVIDIGCGESNHVINYLRSVADKDVQSNYTAIFLDKLPKNLDSVEERTAMFFQNSTVPGELEILKYSYDLTSGLESFMRTLPIKAHNPFFGPTVICTEVAEHINFTEDFTPEDLIKGLTYFGGPVIFSAAYPGQPGDGHVFCQYPSYWIKHFFEESYAVLDFRRAIWPLLRRHFEIPFWEIQNTLLFIPGWTLAQFSELLQNPVDKDATPDVCVNEKLFESFDYVHPIMLEGILNGWKTSQD